MIDQIINNPAISAGITALLGILVEVAAGAIKNSTIPYKSIVLKILENVFRAQFAKKLNDR